MTPIFRTNGMYLGFMLNSFLFSRDGEYLGWIENNYFWNSEGKFLGQIWQEKYIIFNQFAVPPVPKNPRIAPTTPAIPPPPANISPTTLSTGWKDAF